MKKSNGLPKRLFLAMGKRLGKPMTDPANAVRKTNRDRAELGEYRLVRRIEVKRQADVVVTPIQGSWSKHAHVFTRKKAQRATEK